MSLLLGTIAEKDGMICLRTAANVFYPLNGNSRIAEKFRESFNAPQRTDIGRRLYDSAGVLQMENMEQAARRQRRELAVEAAPDYAPAGQRVTWGTRTRLGDLCFSGLRTLREARRLKAAWDKEFPDYAPYSITRNGRIYHG